MGAIDLITLWPILWPVIKTATQTFLEIGKHRLEEDPILSEKMRKIVQPKLENDPSNKELLEKIKSGNIDDPRFRKQLEDELRRLFANDPELAKRMMAAARSKEPPPEQADSSQTDITTNPTPRKKNQRKSSVKPVLETPQVQVSLMHNSIEICVAGTAKGWLLPVDGLVIRTLSNHKEPNGALYRNMLNSFDQDSQDELSTLLKKEIQGTNITIDSPLVVQIRGTLGKKVLPFMPGDVAHIIIKSYLEDGPNEAEEMREMINGVLAAAKRYSLGSLVMPILSTGIVRDDEQSVEKARLMLDVLLAARSFGSLKKIIIVTVVPDVVEMSRRRFNAYLNNRAQPFSNDEPNGIDLLGISAELNALADTLLLCEVRPPLAVGITGGWGSGKSFAMHLLQQRMTQMRLRSVSKGWPDDSMDGNLSQFVGHVYQIRFNAWTYAKSNLWASLMHTIFFELNRQISLEKVFDKGSKETSLSGGDVYKYLYEDGYQLDEAEYGPDALKILDSNLLWQSMREQKQTELAALRILESDIAEWKSKREGVNKKQLDEIQKELGEQAHFAAAEILKQKITVLAGDVLDTQGRELLQKKNLNVAQVEKLLASLRSIQAVWNYVYNVIKKSRVNIALVWLLAILLVGSLLITLLILADILKWDFTTYLAAQAGTFVAALLPLFRLVANWSQRVNEIVHEYQTAVDTEMKNWQATRDARIAEKQARDEEKVQEIINDPALTLAEKLQQVKALAENNVVAHDKVLEILNAQAEDQRRKVGPTARYLTLLEFVRSRLDADCYENKLGLLHQVSDDFRELTASLVHINSRAKELFPRGEPRVILFIDDLDRCPPSRVVEVLEAVQLLLKTELFVVILGLDTRYVTRALEKEYKEILQHEGDPSGLDYIEKIIQIPYRVRPMESTGLQNYLKSQMQIETPTLPAQTPISIPVEPEKNKRKRKTKVEAAQPATSVAMQSTERSVELPPEIIKFQPEDLEDLALCCQQVDLTPRSVKRLVNVFKLIKIFWYRGVGGDQKRPVKQAVMSLLALSAAYPEIMRETFVRLNMWLRNGDLADKTLFEELTSINFDTALTKTYSLNMDFFKRDMGVFKSKGFGNIPLSELDLSTLNLVRSFSFVGDPSYWADQPQSSRTGI